MLINETAIVWVAIAALCLSSAGLVVILAPSRRAARVVPDRLLTRRLHHSRLGAMLRRHHVTEAEYFAHVPHDEAIAQIDACVDCKNSFHCDQVLTCKGAVARNDVSFCPNGETVAALSFHRLPARV